MMLPLTVLAACFLVFAGRVIGQQQPRCEAFLDLTLIIDSSGSVDPADFEKGKEALIDLVGRLNVDVQKAGVAIINFASTLSLSAETDVFEYNKLQLLQQIAALPRIGTGTATGEALDLARQYCEVQCRDINKAIPRVFAVFTDGHSNEGRDVLTAAAALRGSPIEGTVFAVGIGNIGVDGQAELLGIAGDPSYVMNINSYLDLARVTNAITMLMCEFPAFVGPDVTVRGEITGNQTRYYKMNTLHKFAKNAFFEIELNDRAGKTYLYTSTTNKKPSSYSSKSTLTRAANKNTFTTYVPATAKNFYFSINGASRDLNQYDFIVRVRPLNF